VLRRQREISMPLTIGLLIGATIDAVLRIEARMLQSILVSSR